MELKDNDNVTGGLELLMQDVCSHDETIDELKAAAFEALLLNPGCNSRE